MSSSSPSSSSYPTYAAACSSWISEWRAVSLFWLGVAGIGLALVLPGYFVYYAPYQALQENWQGQQEIFLGAPCMGIVGTGGGISGNASSCNGGSTNRST